jgi:phosphatidylglycerophosphatase A
VGFPIGNENSDSRDSGLACDRGENLADLLPLPLGIGRWSRWIAVAGGCGYVPHAPGTAGSAAGALLFLLAVVFFRGTNSVGLDASQSAPGALLSPAAFLAVYGLSVASLLLLGIRAAGRAEVDFGRRDDGRIVIDEVVGQLVALAPLALLFRPEVQSEGGHTGFFELSIAVVTGFVLFRLFDVWKPGAVGWTERRFKGGFGVMADDVVAGVYGAVCLTVLHWLVLHPIFQSGQSGLESALPASSVNAGASIVLAWAGIGVVA